DCSGLALPDSQMPQGEWWPMARLGEAGLPTLFARAAQVALAGGEETDA
ncbi:MAG TPA: A/G-specific adenine glycosylase, partial [Novosphingobium sp.]|nr:A/G-specific adenine glycosylase [Novosphingobium sp.]